MAEEHLKNPEDKKVLVEQLVSIERISFNLAQSVIVTTEDKVRISLSRYLKYAGRRKEWIAPLSLLIAIITTLVTATFDNFIFNADTWKALFVISAIFSTIWLIWSLSILRKNVTIDHIIEDLRRGDKSKFEIKG